MNDEERVDEYLRNGVCKGCTFICEGTCWQVRPIEQAFLDGLAKGRKEVEKEDIDFCNAFCMKADKRVLLEQIEKMKCCDNCMHVKYDWNDQLRIGKCKTCERFSNWEIRK